MGIWCLDTGLNVIPKIRSVMQQGAFVRKIIKNCFFPDFQTVRHTVEIEPAAVNTSYSDNLPPSASPPTPKQSGQGMYTATWEQGHQNRYSLVLLQQANQKHCNPLVFSLSALCAESLNHVSLSVFKCLEMIIGNLNKNAVPFLTVYY